MIQFATQLAHWLHNGINKVRLVAVLGYGVSLVSGLSAPSVPSLLLWVGVNRCQINTIRLITLIPYSCVNLSHLV